MNPTIKSALPALLLLAFGSVVAACGYGGGNSYVAPGSGNGAPPPSVVGPMTIGFALPSGVIGTINTSFGTIGGYTQSTYSQVIGFPTGTKVTLKNLSSSTPHTLNVLSTTGFPANPALSSSASGNGTLTAGYASGVVNPGATTTVMLSTPGMYFIGCAFHYPSVPSMRGVIEVGANATPGPQATPPPSSGGSGGGGSGGGY